MNKRRRLAILGIVLILSVAMVIRWIDGEHILPWESTITLHHPQKVLPIEDGWMVVDNGNHRLIHITANGQADQIMTSNGPKSVASGVFSFYVDSADIYMAGSQIREGGIYTKDESILRYNIHSKQTQILYHQVFGDSARVVRGQVLCIWKDNGRLFFVRDEQTSCNIYSFPLEDEITEMPAPVLERSTVINEPLIRANRIDNDIILYCKYHHTWVWNEDGIQLADYETYKYTEEIPFNDKQKIPLSFGVILHNILFLIAILNILGLICFAISYLLRKRNKNNEAVSRHSGRDAILIVISTLLIAGFYTQHLYKDYQEGYFKQICSLREQLEYLIHDQYADVLTGIAQQGEKYILDEHQRERTLSLDYMMCQLTQCPSLHRDVYSDVFMVDDEGNGVNVADANATYIFWDVMSTADEVKHILNNPHPGQPYRIWDETGFYYASIVPTEVNGRLFCIEVGCYIEDVRDASLKMVMSLFFELLIIFLIIYTIFSLARRLPEHMSSFRKSRIEGRSDAGVWLAGVVAFLFYAISAIDQGVMVYLVYSLSEGCTPAQLALRASLPMLLYMGIGMTAYLIHPILRKWFGDRWCNMGAGILAVCVFCIMGLSVIEGSFVVYCIGKGLSGMIMGIIFNSMYALPLIAKDNSLRNEGLAAITLSCLAANILFISLGGYISQYFGYSAVYFVNGLLGIIFIFVAATVFPKRGQETAEDDEPNAAPQEDRLKRALQFLLSGKMIAYYLGILLPFGMMNAFCYYLYPIYAEKAGISVSQLANLIVLGYALAYIFGEKLVRWKNERNGLWVLVNVFVIMAMLEITFCVSGNIYWATLVLMICCVMVAIPRSEANVFIAEESKRKGLDVRDTNSGFAFALDATEAVASPLMGWCVGAGLIVGTNMIGVISLILTSIFAFWQRKDEKKARMNREECE